ncbi:helix-turn-helix transcriptional regulator [Pedobacter sp. B4-66]|uniref:helix-turn-helix domain-containing protein n=1 Tax=Pedobacter sp. B4-66 TaxID=2817280 RepID=UPI001BD9D955|nr:helix-turn-helix transcriptional regulator [Pedobacter sp. B4-66]
MNTDLFKPLSIGRKIEKIRKLRDISQQALAKELGMTRQGISKLEKSETIEDEKLDQIALALGVTSEGIRDFNQEAALNNYFYEQNNSVINYQVNNPLDFCMSLVEENKSLYQQLVQSEREKVEMLQKMLSKK